MLLPTPHRRRKVTASAQAATGNGVATGLSRAGAGPRRLLLCVDERSTIPDLVAYAQRAEANGQSPVVRVVHVIDYCLGGLAPEVQGHARDLVDEAVFELQMAGLGGEGAIRHSTVRRTAATLLDEAATFGADSIVIGAPRHRLFGYHVRERVLRHGGATAAVAPHRPS